MSEIINASMLVAEINRRFPQCRPVFEKYGIAGCGGPSGPPEPLFIFAAAHHVPLPVLMDELNRAARGEWKEETPRPQPEISEALYKRFVLGALFVALTAGFTLGAANMARIASGQSYAAIGAALKQAHGHAQVFGWAGLLIMGVALHAVPRFKMTGLRSLPAAKVCFGLMLTGVLVRALAQPFSAGRLWSGAVVGSAALELAAAGIFAWLIANVARGSAQRREFYEKFIYASVAWLVVLAVGNAGLTAQMFARGWPAADALWNAVWVHAALFGFMANMIFGFSLRVLPHFVGLRETKVLPANVAFWLWNAAILFRYPTHWLNQTATVASVLELAAAALFVWALGIFARRRTKIEIAGVDNAFAWFLRLGYAWLLVAALQPFHADLPRLTASSRHAMAVGFATAIILGVGHRVLPVFHGANLWSNRLLRATFWVFAAGSTLVLAMAFSAARPAAWEFAWAATTGVLVLAAMGMAALNLAMTLRTRPAAFTRESPVTPQTRVAELLETWPELRPVLIHGGLAGLAAMSHNPPRFVTIEFAARRHGLDPQPLIAALNDEIKRRKAK